MDATETDDPKTADIHDDEPSPASAADRPARSPLAPHSHGRRSRRSGRPVHVPLPLDAAPSPERADDPRVVIVPIAADPPSTPAGLDDPFPPAASIDHPREHPFPPAGGFTPLWQRGETEPSGPPLHHRRRLAVGILAVAVAAALVGLGITRGHNDGERPTTTTTAVAPSSTTATSSVAPVAAIEPLGATLRVLAGGPDPIGNGGDADRALLRRPTAVARIPAGLVVADAGALRLIRPDGRIEGVDVAGLPANSRIDHLAALTNGRILAVDQYTNRFAVVDGIGSLTVTATSVPATGILTPVSVVGDGSGGALVADPGSGSVWRWQAGAAPMQLLGSLLAPVGVAALDGGRALVTDRGSGQVIRIDGPGRAVVIAAEASIASRVAGSPVALRSTPIAAVPDGSDGVQVLTVDGAVSRLPLRPLANDRASLLTEFLNGATTLVADGRSTLIVATGERRVLQLVADQPGRAAISTVLGDAPWPRFNPDPLLARDLVLIDPTGVAVRPDGAIVVADRGANSIWALDADGSATRLAGTGSWGNAVDNPEAAASSIASPTDVTVRKDGTVVFTEPTFGRIREVRPDGSLHTVAAPKIAEPDLTLFSPGPLAIDARGLLVAGDRFAGGMWAVTDSGVRPIADATPATKYSFAATERDGAVVAMDPFGTAVRIKNGAVSGRGRGLVASDDIVVAGTSDGTNIVVAVIAAKVPGARGDQRSDDFPVLSRSAFDGFGRARTAAMASFDGSLILANSGLRGSVVEATAGVDAPLTSTSLGVDGGRANETSLSDPVALDVAADGTVIIADRGGGRVRFLRSGQLGTLAGDGSDSTRNDPRANAFAQSLADLRDAQVNRDGTIRVIDGPRLLAIDGTGLVTQTTLRDPGGNAVNARSIDEGPDGALLAVADDGRLLRVDAKGSTILTTAPALAKVRVQTNGSVWGVTNTGRVVRLVGDRLVPVDTPRDLPVIASDERDGRLAIVGRDGTVAVRIQGKWLRLTPTTSLTPDRRTNRPAAPRPTDIAVLPDGGIVVTDAGRDSLLVYRESATH